jgi:AcrR family transcriptional regulator
MTRSRSADIAREAGMSLADLRDLFPSKGAILGGLMRMSTAGAGRHQGRHGGRTAHDRVLDVMLRRFDALAPYGGVALDLSRRYAPTRNGAGAQPVALNSWRYMLEAAGIDTSGGTLGALRVQGAVLVFSRAFEAWLDDEPDLARTMAVLDRELKRGEKVMGAADRCIRLTAPFRGSCPRLLRAAAERRPP